MGKQKKGRKHRAVNRTPRPVSTATPERKSPRSGSTASYRPDRGTDLGRVLDGTGYGPVLQQPSASTSGSALRDLESFEPAGPVFYNKARDGGLGHHAQRTWARLNQVGAATVEELSQTVGYTPATILKHLQGLERYGMAKLRSGGTWAATGKSQWSAAKEHNLPDRRAGDRARVFGAALR